MKILLAGGGTGGHFYPLIAVAEEIKSLVEERKLVEAKLYYFSNQAYDLRALFEQQIKFKSVPAGKWRRYFSLRNFIDGFITLWGTLIALFKVYWLFPDVVFSKGGYTSVPIVTAARVLGVPVIIHESDSRPGRANLWAAKFAKKIAVSYPAAAEFFPPKKTAITGNPIRRGINRPTTEGAREFLNIPPELPVILVLGGSLGAKKINDIVVDLLPELVSRFNIIHQTGRDHFTDVKLRSSFVLVNSPHQSRYKVFPYLSDTAMKMAAGAASLAVSRAGSVVFELALWGLPSIIIPIPESISHDQRSNAFTYARSGGAVVIEELNLSPSILLNEITRIIETPELLNKMKQGALAFARPDAARVIAEALIETALGHES